MQAEGCTSSSLIVSKVIPQGSVLGPLLFIFSINDIDLNVSNVKSHFYADDTVLYSSAPNPEGALSQLQLDFNTVQEHLYDLNLVLNADKTKVMLFSNTKSLHFLFSECVSSYRYLGILTDESLSFTNHIQRLVKS